MWLLWFWLFLISASASAATPVTLERLGRIVVSAKGQADEKLNQQLQDVELTERASTAMLARWQAETPGPLTRQTLLVLADQSAFRRPPAGALPTSPSPTLEQQRQMISRSAAYAKQTISHLPDFYAARTTLRFESDPAPEGRTGPLHALDRSRDTILYRDGKEVVHLSAEERKRYGLATPGLSTSGVFGPLLGSVLSDTAQGTLAWSHWEQGADKPLAVFSYRIPQAKSHYRVELGLEYRDHPAYHGEFAVDRDSGAILRLTMEADLEKNSVVIRSAVLVEYGPVTIANRTYICPLKSVTINVFYPACTTTEIGACGALAHVRGFKALTSLNDVNFSQYHVFRADTRILNADNKPSPGDGATAPAPVSEPAPVEQAAGAAPSPNITVPPPVGVPLKAPATDTGDVVVSNLTPNDTPAPNSPLTQATAAPASEAPIFRVTPGIVYVDVVVRDRNHHVVGGLTKNDFHVFEDGHPQTIDAFHAAAGSSSELSLAAAPGAPAISSTMRISPATVDLILFDLLDTSPSDQAYARRQMLKFLEAIPPGRRIGLFVLTTHDLRMVQGLTGSSTQLAAAAKAILPESGALFQSAAGERHSNDTATSMPGLATPKGTDDSVIQDLVRDLAAENFQHGQVRSEFLTEAFRALMKTVEGVSGRKNLFWLAGSFPLNASSEMLGGSRLSVYPISVLGMQTNSINAEMSGNGVPAGPPELPGFGRISQSGQQDGDRGDLRTRAEQIAEQTGGEAFVEINDIAGALRSALDEGENYYSIVYTPTDKQLNGRFRKIRVELARKGYLLAYRQGYFATSTGQGKPSTFPSPH